MWRPSCSFLLSIIDFQIFGKSQGDVSDAGISAATGSDMETTRRIDVGVLSSKHIFLVLPLLIIITAVFLSTLQD